MGIKILRTKPRNLFWTIVYRTQKLLPVSSKTKLKFFLNLEWTFDRLAHEMSFKNYTVENHPFRIFSKKFILVNINEHDIVLDIGCHLGDITSMLAEQAKEVVGIDHDKQAIEIARQRHQKNNLTFIHGDALEFLNGNQKKFNILILSHILEHLDNPKEFLMKFKDQFQSIYIEVPDFDRYYLNHYRKDLGLKLIYSDDDHVSEFDRDELKTLLNECRIEIIREEYRHGVQRLWCSTKN